MSDGSESNEVVSNSATNRTVPQMVDELARMRNEMQRLMGRMQELSNELEARGVKNSSTPPDLPPRSPQLSYLETAPEAIVEGIVRCVSASPRRTDWIRYISSLDLQCLLLSDGILGDTFRGQHVKTLELRNTVCSTYETNDVTLFLAEAHVQVTNILTRAGSNIEKLKYYGDDLMHPPPHMTVWIDTFATHCKNVRHLTLSCTHPRTFERILSCVTGTLESLQLDYSTSMRGHFNAVVNHCVGLKKLTLSPSIELPDDLWPTIGPSLLELELLSIKRETSDVCRAVQDHCRALQKFTNYDFGIRSYESQFLSLLKSYGAQLQFAKANFSMLRFDQLSPLAVECSNCVFELLDTNPDFSRSVISLQYRIHNLSIRVLELPLPENFFVNFSRLRTLNLYLKYGECAYMLINLFKDEKPDLTEVNLLTKFTENATDLVDILATSKTLLRVMLRFESLPSGASVRQLLKNNSLEKLKIIVRDSDFVTTKDVLRACADVGDTLKFLHLSKPSAPPPKPPIHPGGHSRSKPSLSPAFHVARYADLCLPMRHRNTFVHVFGIDVVY